MCRKVQVMIDFLHEFFHKDNQDSTEDSATDGERFVA